jgi:hypothetical protein
MKHFKGGASNTSLETLIYTKTEETAIAYSSDSQTVWFKPPLTFKMSYAAPPSIVSGNQLTSRNK